MPHGTDRLFANESLQHDQFIVSNNGIYRLLFQSDGNLVVYKNEPSIANALWASQTHGKPAVICTMQSDGNLVLYDAGVRAFWSSNTYVHPGSRLIMQDDGNLVIYQPNNTAVWASNTVQQSVLNPTWRQSDFVNHPVYKAFISNAPKAAPVVVKPKAGSRDREEGMLASPMVAKRKAAHVEQEKINAVLESQKAGLRKRLERMKADLDSVDSENEAVIGKSLAEAGEKTKNELLKVRSQFKLRPVSFRTSFGVVTHNVAWPSVVKVEPVLPLKIAEAMDRAQIPKWAFMVTDPRKGRGGVAPAQTLRTPTQAPEPAGQRWDKFTAPFAGYEGSIVGFNKYSQWTTYAFHHVDLDGNLNATSIMYGDAGDKSLGLSILQASVGVWYKMRGEGHVRMSVELEAINTQYELHMAGSGLTQEWAIFITKFFISVDGHQYSPEDKEQVFANQLQTAGGRGSPDVHTQGQFHPPGTRFRFELVDMTRYENGKDVFVSINLLSLQLGLIRYASYSGLLGASWKVHEISLTTDSGGLSRAEQALLPPPPSSMPEPPRFYGD